jgi:hypothetical protein
VRCRAAVEVLSRPHQIACDSGTQPALWPILSAVNALCTTRMSRIATQMQYRLDIVIDLYARHALWNQKQGKLYSNGRSGSFRP